MVAYVNLLKLLYSFETNCMRIPIRNAIGRHSQSIVLRVMVHLSSFAGLQQWNER